MRKLVIAVALASAAVTTPAVARDGSAYVGVEGGLMIVEDTEFDIETNDVDVNEGNELSIDHGRGFDVDVIGGFDFGLFRVEGELAYKRANVDEFTLTGQGLQPGVGLNQGDLDGRTTVLSGMLNALLDFGGEGTMRGYVGGGLGLARVKMRQDFDGVAGPQDNLNIRGTDSGLAWQAIAGIGFPLSPNMEVGLKYRFFNMGNLEFEDDDGLLCGPFGCEPAEINLDGRFRSHSLLASLIFNFGAPAVVLPPPPPPPPPPPAAPATQTCPDGTVVLATEPCPVPPPPPPPPPPAPERG